MEMARLDERPRVAIYCRLSDEDHNKKDPAEDSRSIQTQKAMLRDYAHQQGWDIYDIYSDDDFSGADANRPEYNRLLDDASKGRFHIVLCKHQSRFTRDMVHVERYINDKFREWGIRFVSLLDGADTNAVGNKKSRQINGLVNEWYLEDLSENVRKAYITRKKQGKYLASNPLYGYKKDPNDRCHLIVDEQAAIVVRRIFDLTCKGMSSNHIAAIFNEEGILPPAQYFKEVLKYNFKGADNLRKNRRYQGKPIWHSSSICHILQNETYTGSLFQNRRRTVSYKNPTNIKLPRTEWIITENTHEPIISKEIFEQAKLRRLRAPQMTAKGKSHLFTGKLVCGKCGGSICHNSSSGDNHYYRCHMRANLGAKICEGVSVSEKLLTEAVLKELKHVFSEWIESEDVDLIANTIRLEEENDRTLLEKNIRSRIEELQKVIDLKENLYKDMSDGLISRDSFKELWDRFEGQQKQLAKEISKLEERLEIEEKTEKMKKEKQERLKTMVRERASFFLQCETLTREMLNIFVDYIEVNDGEGRGKKNLKIYWNF